MVLPAMTTECSISELVTRQRSPMAVKGPMKLSVMHGARGDGDRAPDPRAPDRRAGLDDDSPVHAGLLVDVALDRRVPRVSSSSRLASSSGVSLPVSIHHPSSCSVRTRCPLSMSHWMASVISSSPRAEGAMARTAVVDPPVEQVDADEGEVGRRVVRLLDQVDDVAVVVEAGDAEPLRVGHLLEQDLCRRRAGLGAAPPRSARRRSRRSCCSRLSPRYITKSSSPRKSAGDEHAVRQAERGVLADVGDLGAEGAAVADGRHHLVGGVADDHADLDDPGLDHGLDPVEQDRLVGHRHQLLGAGVGDRAEAGAGAAGQDQALHGVRRGRARMPLLRSTGAPRYQRRSAPNRSQACARLTRRGG